MRQRAGPGWLAGQLGVVRDLDSDARYLLWLASYPFPILRTPLPIPQNPSVCVARRASHCAPG